MSTTHPSPLTPPARLLQWLEPSRAASELATTLAAWPWLRLAPRGDGHPVLVLPGLAATDRSTHLLRKFLAGRGYAVHGWQQGRNLGPRSGVREAMLAQLDALHASSGQCVSLVGWSLGGAYAAWLASRRPDAVRGVVTLGSPLAGSPRATRAWRLYEMTSGQSVDDAPPVLDGPVPVPMTSIASRSDGIVAWRASRLPKGAMTENLEVLGSHLGLGVNAAVLFAVADRLAQREGHWRPFTPPLTLLWAFPRRFASAA
jgi:pimeloyl-ACP methyl ester carboxylesterase